MTPWQRVQASEPRLSLLEILGVLCLLLALKLGRWKDEREDWV